MYEVQPFNDGSTMVRRSARSREIAGLLVMLALLTASALTVSSNAGAETPEQWVQLGERIHGGFGSYIALGIRVGLDASERLHAKPRDLEVILMEGPKSPCPCLADGLMLATAATPGRGTLSVSPERAPWEQLAIVIVRNRASGETLRYTIPDTMRATLDEMNKGRTPVERYNTMMAAPEEQLFVREALDQQLPDWVFRH